MRCLFRLIRPCLPLLSIIIIIMMYCCNNKRSFVVVIAKQQLSYFNTIPKKNPCAFVGSSYCHQRSNVPTGDRRSFVTTNQFFDRKNIATVSQRSPITSSSSHRWYQPWMLSSSASSSSSPSTLEDNRRSVTSNPSGKFVEENNPKRKDKRRWNEPITLDIPTVVLKRTKQSRSFREGNQLVFTNSIQAIKSPSTTNTKTTGKPIQLEQGELVLVVVERDSKNDNQSTASPSLQPIGMGTYNNESLYKVRILLHKNLVSDLYEEILRTCHTMEDAVLKIVQYHVQSAIRLRASMGLRRQNDNDDNVDAATTDTYRLINGEGDSLSGLAIDMIGGKVAVVMSSASWCEIYKNTIIKVLQKELRGVEIVWRTTPSRLQQDGYIVKRSGIETLNGNIASDKKKDDDDEQDSQATSISTNDDTDKVNDTLSNKMIVSKENGLLFETYPFDDGGQKTGVYCDQRENRFYIAQYCNNKRVLDLCCYHGGFSITASQIGLASQVIGVDSSPAAIASAQANARRNHCSSDNVQFIQADITNYLQDQYRRSTYYDVVVLDPPKLAPSVKLLDKARRKYHALNRDAIKVIDPMMGGFLFTCTCSAAMTEAEGGQYFISMVQGAALAAGRQVTLLQVRGAAPCHTISPICYPAGAYLTAALFYVHPIHSTCDDEKKSQDNGNEGGEDEISL